MKSQSLLTMLLMSASLATNPVVAQQTGTEEELDVSVIESGEGAEAALRRIELSEYAIDLARENAAFGLETANEARETGQEQARQSRERANAARANASEQALAQTQKDENSGEGEASDAANNARHNPGI